MKSLRAAGVLAVLSATALSSTAYAAASCGTDPVVLNSYFETGFPLPTKLSEEFTKQFPNVTFDIKEDQVGLMFLNAFYRFFRRTATICYLYFRAILP